MSLSNKKLIAILGGRPYKDNLTLRKFFVPSIRQRFIDEGIDFIVATNNKKAAEQLKQINDLKVVVTSDELHNEFMSRQREIKPNLGAETRETINRYAIENSYDLVCHLDDNITMLAYLYNGKKIAIKRNPTEACYDITKLLFNISEKSNSGAVGFQLAGFPGTKKLGVTVGYPYSFFVHRVDKNFKFENSTEDDILMSIYNGINKKPSSVLRGSFYYGKTGKATANDGNRVIYNEMLKENKRGEYISSIYPEIYSRKVTYNAVSSTSQKAVRLQHKHRLKIPNEWRKHLNIDNGVNELITETLIKIHKREHE